jgi:hypothetical protein
MMLRIITICLALSTAGCAGGTQEARLMPTPILCKTILDLGPIYIRSGEYLAELKGRGSDCSEYLGSTSNIRVR